MLINIIIVTHNSEGHISNCLKSLNSFSGRVIAIDNASNDKTRKIIKQNYPKIILINNSNNLGFAKAVNIGIKKSRGDILLLNPDTVSPNNLVVKLKKEAQRSKNIAAVAPKILNNDNSLQPNCGKFPTALNLLLDKTTFIRELFPVSHLIRRKIFYDNHQNPDWISGACMYIKRKVIQEVGLFDERYFMYGEDVDWCYRAKQMGYKLLYTPKITITHFDQGKDEERYPNKFYNMRKGFLIYFKKYKKDIDLALFKFLLNLELNYKKRFCQKDKTWLDTYDKLEKLINEDFDPSTVTTE